MYICDKLIMYVHVLLDMYSICTYTCISRYCTVYVHVILYVHIHVLVDMYSICTCNTVCTYTCISRYVQYMYM